VGVAPTVSGAPTQNTWGWGVDGGLKFNLPMIGAGDSIQLQGAWAQNATWYSGIEDAMWTEAWDIPTGGQGGVNGNGLGMPIADSYYVTVGSAAGRWATPSAWSLTASGEFHLGPTFMIDPEVGYAALHWSGLGTGGQLSPDTSSWVGGAVFHWDPVAHLDFNLELLYQSTNQSRPLGYTTAVGALPWQSTSQGLEGRFEITRDF
jgi:hypothetical protein